MQDQKIYNDTITIEGIELKNNRYTLLAHNGKKYSFWAVKKDGTDSAPFTQFKNMGLKQGDTVFIGYVIEEYDTDYGRKQSNKIINFRESTEQPTQSSQTQEKPRGEAPTRSQSSSNGQFGKRLALHGFANAMLSNGATVETVIKDLPALGKLEDAIDRYLNEPEALTKMREKFGRDDLPTIEAEDEAPSFSDDELPAEEVEGISY